MSKVCLYHFLSQSCEKAYRTVVKLAKKNNRAFLTFEVASGMSIVACVKRS